VTDDRRSASPPTIVIVDDEEMVAGALRGFLELETPYRVLTFTSPGAALERMAEEPAHVIVADFMMPEMDGITLLRHVRSRFPNVTRILLTGYADKQNAIRAINEVGLYHYLEKPWNNDQLRLVIQNAVERSSLVNELDARISALEAANHDLLDLRRRIMRAFL
jgi:DNA-binding NtrC family response regulator